MSLGKVVYLEEDYAINQDITGVWSKDKNILDLDNVRGIITSDKNSTVYIVSDFAEYNSSNLISPS